MKSIYKILLILSVLLIAGFFYAKKYSYYDVVDDKLLYLNPFSPVEKDYSFYALNAKLYADKNDSSNARYFSKKLLEYRNTFNETQFEKIFSCGNDYWEYKQQKLVSYSKAYERIGQTDSAISCLRIGLTNLEKEHFETLQLFFALQVKKSGKQQVIKEIKKGLNTIYKQDCFMCDEYYYPFLDYKIGVDNISEDYKTNPDTVLHKLLKQYQVEK